MAEGIDVETKYQKYIPVPIVISEQSGTRTAARHRIDSLFLKKKKKEKRHD